MEVIVTFFNGVATVDVIVASKLILPKLNPHILRDSIGVLFWENKQSGPRFLAMANFIVCLPPEVPLDVRFYPINPEVRAKMVGIVNKIYRINFLLCQIGRCINVFPEDASLWFNAHLLEIKFNSIFARQSTVRAQFLSTRR